MGAKFVAFESLALAESHHVQPMACPAFSVVRVREQAVDFFDGLGARYPSLVGDYGWFFFLETDLVTGANVDATQENLEGLETDIGKRYPQSLVFTGLGNALASTMAQMASLESPSIAVVIGEGGSEGALALGVANRVLMMENAIYSIISPEDAAGLLYQDDARADEVAESLRLTARDCLELGIVDEVRIGAS